jgi:dipeptidyl-peptidase 4
MKSTFILALLVAPAAIAQGTRADYERAATIRQRYQGLALNLTLRPNWSRDGNRFWFVADRGDGKTEHVLVDLVAKTKTVTDKSKLPSEAKGADSKLPRRGSLDRPPFPDADAKSPDKLWEIVIRDHNVGLKHAPSSTMKPLSFDGTDRVAYGSDCYWSPDSKYVVVPRWSKGGSRRVSLIESAPVDQLQPRMISYDYLKPGDEIPQMQPVLFDVQARREVTLDRALFDNPWSIDHIRWDADSSRFTFLYNARGHQALRVMGIESATGRATAIIDEPCKTFIDYSNKVYHRWLDNGEIVWMSERSGFNHIYRIDGRTGAVKNAITAGPWVVRAVDHFDATTSTLTLRTLGYHANLSDPKWVPAEHDHSPYVSGYAIVKLDGSDFRLLTPDLGTSDLQWNPRRTFAVMTMSTANNAPRHAVIDRTGKELLHLESADITALKANSWRPVEPFLLKGRDGTTDIAGYIVRPSNFDPMKKYPVIEHIYAGPHDFHVNHRFQVVPYEQCLAELGFIIVKMDGMGTNWRSKAFHDHCWRNLQDAGFPDRIAVHKQLEKAHPEMDYSRGVGLFGGSAGGQSTLAGLLHHGDVYRVGVADCGCHDNRMDKIWWNEAWMGWPVGPHYAAQSNVTNAHKLTGKLMLVVGEKDTNVDPASTMQVVSALVKADKDFELLVMPGVGHGAAESPYANRRRQDFFVRHLLGVEPRAR